MSNLEALPDYDTNRDGTAFNCAAIDRASKGILAHSAPLGLSFLQDTAVPTTLRNGAALAPPASSSIRKRARSGAGQWM